MNIVFGIKLQSYRFNQYFSSKKTDKELKVEVVNVIVDNVVSAKSSFKSFETIANNVFFVRDLVSEPANKLHPESYAEICKELETEIVSRTYYEAGRLEASLKYDTELLEAQKVAADETRMKAMYGEKWLASLLITYHNKEDESFPVFQELVK